MSRFFLLLLVLPITVFATQFYLDGNIHAGRHRFFKLDDGSYWETKLQHGYLSCDCETGCEWWRFDPIEIGQGEDPCFPYVLTNGRSGESLPCKQVDPALPESTGSQIAIAIHYTCSQTKNVYSPYLLDANVYAGKHRFFRLDDGSYWEVQTDSGLFTTDVKTGAFWRRGDQIKLECSEVVEFPYLMVNQRSGESLLSRQVDPAIPDSTSTVLYVDRASQGNSPD